MKTFKRYMLNEGVEEFCETCMSNKSIPGVETTVIKAILVLKNRKTKVDIKNIEEDSTVSYHEVTESNLHDFMYQHIGESNIQYTLDKSNNLEPANGSFFLEIEPFAKNSSIRTYLHGVLHSTEHPTFIIEDLIQFHYYGNYIVAANTEDKTISFGMYKIDEFFKSNDKDGIRLLQNTIKYIPIENIIDAITKHKENQYHEAKKMLLSLVANHAINGGASGKCKTTCILHLIQPEMFSDKIAKLLMDKIPLNLSYFILTKHMELYNNILSCYSDKHKFIENIKEGDDIHHMGIANALERLIKHEDI